MGSSLTVRQVVDQMLVHELVDADRVTRALDSEALGESLDYFGTPDHLAVLGLFYELGIRYVTDYKTFRGGCEDGVELYREELERIAACTGGLLTITDVELAGVEHDPDPEADDSEADDSGDDEVGDDDDEDGGHLLRFRCNGVPHEWAFACGPDESIDAQLTFAMSLSRLVPTGSPQRWCRVDPPDSDVGSEAVFGDPEALCRFGARYGLTFTP